MVYVFIFLFYNILTLANLSSHVHFHSLRGVVLCNVKMHDCMKTITIGCLSESVIHITQVRVK